MLYLTLSAVAEDVVAASSNNVKRLSRVNRGKLIIQKHPVIMDIYRILQPVAINLVYHYHLSVEPMSSNKNNISSP